MLQRSGSTLVVADHSKFDATFPARYASWQQVDYLVTDEQPTDKLASALSQHKVIVRRH